jgi:hypothetical protein
MGEFYKQEIMEASKCNVYITVNCCKDDKHPYRKKPEEWKKSDECNVNIIINCCKDDKDPRFYEKEDKPREPVKY